MLLNIMTKRRRDQSSRSCSWNHKSFSKVTSFYRVGKEKVLKCLGSLSTHPWDKRGNLGMALSLSLSCSLHSSNNSTLIQLFSDFVTWFYDWSGSMDMSFWVNSGSWWWTGRPGVLRFMGSQRVRHDWATELNWTGLVTKWKGNSQEGSGFPKGRK